MLDPLRRQVTKSGLSILRPLILRGKANLFMEYVNCLPTTCDLLPVPVSDANCGEAFQRNGKAKRPQLGNHRVKFIKGL